MDCFTSFIACMVDASLTKRINNLYVSFSISPENLVIPSHLQKEALELQRVIEFDDDGGEGELNTIAI